MTCLGKEAVQKDSGQTMFYRPSKHPHYRYDDKTGHYNGSGTA